MGILSIFKLRTVHRVRRSFLGKLFGRSQSESIGHGRGPSAPTARPPRQFVRESLRLIITHAEAAGASSLKIHRDCDRFVYRFRCADGSDTEGGIRLELVESMTALLGDLARVTDEWCCFPEGREKILVRVIDGEEEGSFRVVWRHLSRLEEGTSGPAPYLETPRHRLNDCALEYEEEVVPQGEGPLVLLVEDNLDFARIMKKLFKHHDIELVHAETGDMALGLLEASQRLPALVISDFHMPKMNGAFFIRQLRRMTRFKRTPVIMLTSDEQTDIEVHSIETGADAFIGKSENPKILFAHVMRFLEREGWVKEAAAL